MSATCKTWYDSTPEELLGETGLVFQGEEVRMGDFRFDLVFRDRQGATLLVELQRGRLDRTHLYKVLDYADRYRAANPGTDVECMVVANEISGEYKDRLQARGIDYREISLTRFAEFGRDRGYIALADVGTGSDDPAPTSQAYVTSAPAPAQAAPEHRAPSSPKVYMTAGSQSAIGDPQAALKREFVRDSSAFIPKAEFKHRYGNRLILWDRNYFEAMGFPLPAKVSASDRKDASAKVLAKVREQGSLVTLMTLRPGYGLKITLDDTFQFGAANHQLGFVLTCLVFGWLDDTESKLTDLGVKTHHFYDLERRYRVGEACRVVPGLVVEGFVPN